MRLAAVRPGLCLVLTLWFASTRPSMATRSGTPISKAWWESGEFSRIRAEAAEYKKKGDLAGWESAYQRGYSEARRQGIVPAQISYLSALGNIRMLRFHYQEALAAYLEGRQLAERAGDWLNAGGIAVNLTSLYTQVWDLPSAIAAAEQGRAALAHVPSAYYKPQLLLQAARLHASQNDPDAEALFLAAVEAARQQPDLTLPGQAQDSHDAASEALAWDLLGLFRIQQGRLKSAEEAITEAFRIRKLYVQVDLATSYASLGALKLACGEDLVAAERFTDRAIAAAEQGSEARPLHVLLNQRGRIYLKQGRMPEALQSLRSAVEWAVRWRRGVPSSGSALTSSNMELDRGIFDSFVETAAGEALATGNAELAAESFLAAETSRASSLRETQALSSVWRRKLPPAYWENLSLLRSEQAKAVRDGRPSKSKESRLQLELTEMEAVAGLGFFSNIAENFRDQNSLTHFQRRLKRDELFLSFHLGRESFLWAVTDRSLRIYRLDPEQKIRGRVMAFREAVATGRAEAADLGQKLYQSLFGPLGQDQLVQKRWLLSLEDSLFEAPFAALVLERIGGQVRYLIEEHSLQIVPGAFSLDTRLAPLGGRMVAVGDPIYNGADPRWGGRQAWWRGTNPPLGAGLNRLPGSGVEARSSARAWGDATVLEGEKATRSGFLQALETAPGVVHLATHVLADGRHRDQAFVAFGMEPDGQPGLLAAPEIAALRVTRVNGGVNGGANGAVNGGGVSGAGPLVVMTGCASGSGEFAAGAGLLGLTRAWLEAGASGVVSTAWPVSDRSAPLLTDFYRSLKSTSPAEALRQMQVGMRHSGTWQAAPAYWAAYQMTGGAR